MDEKLLLAGFLALMWGLGWGALLWETAWGRFLRLRRTWVVVVIGVGVDVVLAGLVLDLRAWVAVAVIVAASGVGIVGWCLEGEYREHLEERAEAERRR